MELAASVTIYMVNSSCQHSFLGLGSLGQEEDFSGFGLLRIHISSWIWVLSLSKCRTVGFYIIEVRRLALYYIPTAFLASRPLVNKEELFSSYSQNHRIAEVEQDLLKSSTPAPSLAGAASSSFLRILCSCTILKVETPATLWATHPNVWPFSHVQIEFKSVSTVSHTGEPRTGRCFREAKDFIYQIKITSGRISGKTCFYGYALS